MARHPDGVLYRCPNCTHCFTDPHTVAIENYDDDYFERRHRRWFANPDTAYFSAVARRLPEGASVVDVGCGRGDFLHFVRRMRPDLALTGIDLAANQDVEGIRFIQGDVHSLSIDDTFDVVIAQQVIEHVEDPHAFLESLARLAKPGALVIVSTINESSLLYGLARAGRRTGIPLAFNRLYSSHHLQHFTRLSLRTLLEQHHFRVDAEVTHNAPLAAIDIPVANRAADAVLRAGMWMVCRLGEVANRSYLQTITSITPPPASGVSLGRA
jgi:2-polyprenyl-3-methyl-5-hydroxy-6-metoxy-1,4-benzoquinol methylase